MSMISQQMQLREEHSSEREKEWRLSIVCRNHLIRYERGYEGNEATLRYEGNFRLERFMAIMVIALYVQ